MQKNFLPARQLSLRWLLGAALVTAGLCAMAPARADPSLEALTNILPVPGSAGLGVLERIHPDPQ